VYISCLNLDTQSVTLGKSLDNNRVAEENFAYSNPHNWIGYLYKDKGIKQRSISFRTVTTYLACVLDVPSSNLKYEVVLRFLAFFVKPFKGMRDSKGSSTLKPCIAIISSQHKLQPLQCHTKRCNVHLVITYTTCFGKHLRPSSGDIPTT
jgi:hypothetical protein